VVQQNRRNPAAGGTTIVLSLWRVKIGRSTLFADEPEI